MIRISNRGHSEHKVSAGPQIQVVERIVEVPVEIMMVSKPERIEVEVPVERIVEIERLVEKEAIAVDLTGIHAHLSKHEEGLRALNSQHDRWFSSLHNEY